MHTSQSDLDQARSPAKDAEPHRTLRLSIWEGAAWAVMSGCGDVYAAPFAIFLQASNRIVAMVTSMPVWMGVLAQGFGAAMVERWPHRRKWAALCNLVQALMFLLMYFLPLFFRSSAPIWLVFCYAIAQFAYNASSPGWVSLMGDLVPAVKRGGYFGQRNRMMMMVIFLSSLVAGGVLALSERAGWMWAGYGVVFFAAFAFRVASAWMMFRHFEPAYTPSPEARFSLWDFIAAAPRSNFARYALYFSLMNGAVAIAGPFFSVYMLRDLGWSYARFVMGITTVQIAQFMVVPWWGRMGDRYGNRAILVATGLYLPVLPTLWLFNRSFPYIILVQIMAGCVWGGFNLAATNFLYDAVTPSKRARVSAYVAILNGVFSLIGGVLVGVWFADHLPSVWRLGPVKIDFMTSLPGVFLASGLLRMLVSVLGLPTFAEVREVEKIHPLRLLVRALSGEPLVELARRWYKRRA